ncbi:MAG: AraC family transcriptional regulator [Novosphingobium sp.]
MDDSRFLWTRCSKGAGDDNRLFSRIDRQHRRDFDLPRHAAKLDLSELLGSFELRGRRWCIYEIAPSWGIKARGDNVAVYVPLEGTCCLQVGGEDPIHLRAGEGRFVLSSEDHALFAATRGERQCGRLVNPKVPDNVDRPPTIAVGNGEPVTKLLYGQLDAEWPAGMNLDRLPPVMASDQTGAARSIQGLVLATITDLLADAGAAALLTRYATLSMAIAIRTHPNCTEFFDVSDAKARLLRAKQLIAADHAAHWTVGELADRVGMGRSSFSAGFKAEFGMTPMACLTEKRMEHAAILLQTGSFKVSEVASRTGYDSPQSFFRCFKQHFGSSPEKWRKAVRRRD